MNPVPLFLIIVTLPLLLGGCGEKGVNYDELEQRESIWYLIGSDTPYTGKAYRLHENGQKWIENNLKDGKGEGLWVRWHENGQKEQEGNIKDGKQNGLQTHWHENGQKLYEGNYKEGKRDGLFVSWHKNGQKKEEGNYKNGKLISGKFWNSKGEPVANTQPKPEGVNKKELEEREGIIYLKGSDTPYTGNP